MSERAKTLGFDPSQTWFHGSTKDLPAFAAKRALRNEQMGLEGVHLAQDPAFASRYAEGPGGNVTPVHVRGKILDATQMVPEGGEHHAIVDKLLKGTGRKPYWTTDEKGRRWAPPLQNHIDGVNPQKAKRVIQEHGYDGVKYNASYGSLAPGARGMNTTAKSPAVVMFDPSNIRARTAQFDPQQVGSAALLAARGGAMLDQGKAVRSALSTAKSLYNKLPHVVGGGAPMTKGGRIHRDGGGEIPNQPSAFPVAPGAGAPIDLKQMFGAAPSAAPAPAAVDPSRLNAFTPHPDSHTIGSLTSNFNDAVKHHLGLSTEERNANAKKARDALAPFFTNRKDGKAGRLMTKNAKMMKAESGYRGQKPLELNDGKGIETIGLPLSPAYEEGKLNTCPNSASCKTSCLGKTSGNYFKVGGGENLDAFKGPRLNSLIKTQAMMRHPQAFAVAMHDEIDRAKQEAARNGNRLGVRLNVLSDLHPRMHEALIRAHPDVAFYDYTKNNTDPIAPNHHYTYSSTGVSQPASHNGSDEDIHNPHSNWRSMRKRLDTGSNVAMVFTHKEHLPQEVHDEESGKRYRVVHGDTHDFRPADIQPHGADGVIVGLRNKKAPGKLSRAAHDTNGFMVHYDPQIVRDAKGREVRGPSYGINPDSGNPYRGESTATNHVVRIAPQPEGRKSIFAQMNKGLEK